MNFSTYRFTLDLQKHQSQMSIAVFKNDTAVKLFIGLTDGGKPYYLEDGVTAILYGKRADDEEIVHRCVIKDNTEIIYEFESTTSCVEGLVQCQLRLYGLEGALITAPRFVVVVDERVVNDEAVNMPGNTLSALDAIFATEEERKAAEEKRAKAESARNIAESLREIADKERERVLEWDDVIVTFGSIYGDGKNWLSGKSGNVLVKGVTVLPTNCETADDYANARKIINVPKEIKVIKFVNCKIFGNLIGTADTKIIGFVGHRESNSMGEWYSRLYGFGGVESCSGDLILDSCSNIINCQIKEATYCRNLLNIECSGENYPVSFANCERLYNIRLSNISTYTAEFYECNHIGNVHSEHRLPYTDGRCDPNKIGYTSCTFVDGDTCGGYYKASDVGKVQTITADGTKRAVSVYSQEETYSRNEVDQKLASSGGSLDEEGNLEGFDAHEGYMTDKYFPLPHPAVCPGTEGGEVELIPTVTMQNGKPYLSFLAASFSTDWNIPLRKGNKTFAVGNQLQSDFAPEEDDLVSARWVNAQIGDVDSVLDSIIAMQNALIGGEA